MYNIQFSTSFSDSFGRLFADATCQCLTLSLLVFFSIFNASRHVTETIEIILLSIVALTVDNTY